MAKIRQGIFGVVPLALLADDPPRAGTHVYIALASFQGSADNSWPSIAQIAERANLNERETKRGVKWLKEKGWIEVRRRRNNSSVYKALTDGQEVPESVTTENQEVPESVTPEVPESGPTGSAGIRPTKKNNEKEQMKKNNNDVGPLYHAINAAFLSKNGDHYSDWGREGKAVKTLVKRLEDRYNGKSEEMAKKLMETFYSLTQGKDKFWSGQPFLPSALSTYGIYTRVEAACRENVGADEWMDRHEQETARRDAQAKAERAKKRAEAAERFEAERAGKT